MIFIIEVTNSKKIVVGIAFFLIFSFMLPVNAEIDSPKKQMKRGISVEDVLCRDGLELVIRTNGSPACVKPETAEKMHKESCKESGVKELPTADYCTMCGQQWCSVRTNRQVREFIKSQS